MTGCPDCTATWTTSGHVDVTPAGTCDVPPTADIAQGGAALDQMLAQRVLIPWATAPITDTLPAVGASWTQIAAQLGSLYGTPTYMILGDYSAIGIPGDYLATNYARVGILFNDGTAIDGFSDDYTIFTIIGFQI